jgi:hypothetical protein
MSLWKRFMIVTTVIVTCGLALLPMIQVGAAVNEPARSARVHETASSDNAVSVAAFESMVKVLHHPRCMNCHSTGDFPRQGDDGHRHAMNVRRGLEGDGVTSVRCGTCHQDHNLEGVHMPPGAPDWHLPNPKMPMIWEGLSDGRLCELFKDPRLNGNRTVNQIVEHMSTPLVLWGWNPGEGRTAISVTKSQFLAEVKEWASKGAACPAP